MKYKRIPDKHRGRYGLCGLPWLFILGALIFLIGACASSPAALPDKEAGQGIAVVPVEKAGLFREPSDDAMILNEGVSWMGLSDKPADFAKARAAFTAVTKDRPTSQWRSLAETLMRIIDTIESLQAKNLSAQAQMETLLQENERIKNDLQTLGNRFQVERAGLLQENEQLKKDMESLKKLEVQLDQREKMLR
jgi:hypothetical protein